MKKTICHELATTRLNAIINLFGAPLSLPSLDLNKMTERELINEEYQILEKLTALVNEQGHNFIGLHVSPSHAHPEYFKLADAYGDFIALWTPGTTKAYIKNLTQESPSQAAQNLAQALNTIISQ